MNGWNRPERVGVPRRRIYRFLAKMAEVVGSRGSLRHPVPLRQLRRRSGCVPALPYPPLSLSHGRRSVRRCATIFHQTATALKSACLTLGVHPRSTGKKQTEIYLYR